MNFLTFIDTSFILTLGLILLICGSIMIYCYRRLNILENSVIEHGKILQEFINNYNNQLMINNLYNNSTSNNTENTTTTLNTNNTSISQEILDTKSISLDSEKINISDDDNDVNHSSDSESSDDEEDSDDDSDSIDSENGSDDDKDTVQHLENNIKINELDNKINLETSNTKKILTDITDIGNSNLSIDDISINPNIQIDNLDILTNPLNITNLDNKSSSGEKIITLLDNVEDNNEKKNLNKMKVDDLRTLAVTKNLINNNDALKLKKSELIKLLEK
tara:strand:- start:2823 stop:3653 length:831 start_codon:yes stop_codon:yes gene_type:complete